MSLYLSSPRISRTATYNGVRSTTRLGSKTGEARGTGRLTYQCPCRWKLVQECPAPISEPLYLAPGGFAPLASTPACWRDRSTKRLRALANTLCLRDNIPGTEPPALACRVSMLQSFHAPHKAPLSGASVLTFLLTAPNNW